MAENGSPKPIFDANEPERTFFISEFHLHKAFSEEENETSDQVISLLKYCKAPKSRLEILTLLGISNHFYNYKNHILPLLEQNWLEYTIKENPKDRNQKYQLTELGKSMLND